VPTGAQDPIVPLINARFSVHASQNATVRVVPDAGHLLLMDSAVDCAQTISRFLRVHAADN
jgi:pimeloyl-ACP methyl ester carboxylesterase